MRRESQILKEVREALNTARNSDGLLRCRVIRNSVGFDESHRVRYGLGNGSADLVGVLRSGRAFSVETKTDRGRLREDQIAWWRAYRAWGGTGGVARSAAEALQLLDEAERDDRARDNDRAAD